MRRETGPYLINTGCNQVDHLGLKYNVTATDANLLPCCWLLGGLEGEVMHEKSACVINMLSHVFSRSVYLLLKNHFLYLKLGWSLLFCFIVQCLRVHTNFFRLS